MISKCCSSTDNTRLLFLSSLSMRPSRAELSCQLGRSSSTGCSSDGSTGTAARCPARLGTGEDFTRRRWYLQPESQAGEHSPPPPPRCSTPAQPRQMVWRMLQVQLLEAENRHKILLVVSIGTPSWISQLLYRAFPGGPWDYSGSFCLNPSFTKVERPSETQTAHLHLI